jgi:hypothetical protein
MKKNYPKIYVSGPILLDIKKLEGPLEQADIIIHGLDISGFSYEGRVFLNNPYANQDTPLSLENGYIGSYYVLGYGGFIQVENHMERTRHDYGPSQLPVSQSKRIIITDALRRMGRHTDHFVISIVPVVAGSLMFSSHQDSNIIKLEKIGINAR